MADQRLVHECVECGSLEDVRPWLEAQGLYVVTAAERAMLDAAQNMFNGHYVRQHDAVEALQRAVAGARRD